MTVRKTKGKIWSRIIKAVAAIVGWQLAAVRSSVLVLVIEVSNRNNYFVAAVRWRPQGKNRFETG